MRIRIVVLGLGVLAALGVARPGDALPAAVRKGGLPLREALAQRRSVREFEAAPLTREQIGQLLWAAQGITDARGYRTAPSAGALYPLEVYVATAEGVFHYRPHDHALARLSDQDVRVRIHAAALRQEPLQHAPAIFVVAGVYERTAKKYGPARSPRYVHLEAGHACQNLLLEAVALGLGAVPIGAFDDAALQRAVGLPRNHRPLYLIPTGRPG
ncbi:MAG: SagB/ThcOx family dehydrogenase [Planctomycetota bacterium]|jgi:SagB-type dehydrogenase family enzyme